MVIVFFLGFPGGFEATVDYELYTLDDPSRTVLVMKPILLTALTVVLISIVSITYRRTRAVTSDRRSRATGSYWDYFASRIVNWIAIAVGACLLVATSVIDLVALNTEMSGWARDWISDIGLFLLAYGLFFGLAITWSSYRKETS